MSRNWIVTGCLGFLPVETLVLRDGFLAAFLESELCDNEQVRLPVSSTSVILDLSFILY